MLGWSAASKIIYVRPVGRPENTSNTLKTLNSLIKEIKVGLLN